jgi:HAD superfamily hydrolase (TIGR01509 family)
MVEHPSFGKKAALTVNDRRPQSAVLFAFEEVLQDTTAWSRWLVQLLRRLGYRAEHERFLKLWNTHYVMEARRGDQTCAEAMHRFLTRIGVSASQAIELELACSAKRRQLEEESRLLPGVRATVLKLSELGLKLGILSDSAYTGDQIRQRLARFHLDSYFAAVVSSRDTKSIKPEAAGYTAALREMRVSPNETIFVGHTPEEIGGAARLGMETLTINQSVPVDSTSQLDRLETLPDWIAASVKLADAG